MESSRQLPTPKLSEATRFSFPPHCRRPLRSHTYFNLIHLLSHCPTDFPHPRTQGDVDGVELRQASEENVLLSCGEMKSPDLLVPEDTSIQGTSNDKNKPNVGFQDECVDGKRTIPEVDPITLVTDGDQEIPQENNSIDVGDFMVDEKLNVGCSVQIVDEQENIDGVVELQTNDFGPLGQLELNKEFCIDDFSEVLDSCFGMDIAVESSKYGEDSKENGSALEVAMSKDFEHHVQLKEMELENLVSTCAVDLSCPVTADEEIEEEEISGEACVFDVSMDALSNDAMSLGGITAGIVHASENNVDKEEFIHKNEDIGLLRDDAGNPLLIGTVDRVDNCMKAELGKSSQQMQDIQSQNIFCCSFIKTQETDPIVASSEILPLTGRPRILQEISTKIPTGVISEKDGDDIKKKRKNGPLTKERRAKKKKKDRLKRAEKNRKLGIKRLKLQPVLKPKTIKYCRHYLQGRCHEGEKCKFSHDTIPLTKSKPCGHFARHSCMKGEDCPYDHQLSKYPCNNYLSTGFCSRGADCLFSHEVPSKQIISTTSNVLKPVLKSEQHAMPGWGESFTTPKADKPEVKVIAPLNNSGSSKPADTLTSHHKVDAKFFSTKDSPAKSTEKHVTKPFARIVAEAPKGVSFLSYAKMPIGRNRKLKIDGSCQKASDGVDVGRETILKVPGSINKLAEVSEKRASRKPRGINFLSFAQSSLDDSSSKTFSNLFSNVYKETEKPVISDLTEGKQTRILQSGDFFEVNSQINQSATTLAQKLNEEANRTPATLPPHMNSLSFGKPQSDDSVLRAPADFHCNKVVTSLSSVQERTMTSGNCPVKMPWRSSGGSWDQSTAVELSQNITSPFKTSLLSNTPSLVQKAVQSTLAFAAKLEPEIKLDHSFTNGEARSSLVYHGHS